VIHGWRWKILARQTWEAIWYSPQVWVGPLLISHDHGSL